MKSENTPTTGKEMSTRTIDARGLSCPQPVILAKKGIEELSKGGSVDILVDTDTARENIARLAGNLGCRIAAQESEGAYRLIITRE